jgi:lipase
MLMRGTASPPPMLELVDALHALMPGNSRVIVEGASHLLPLTHADAITDAILSHLHADAERRLR